jgi:hypothetical protein
MCQELKLDLFGDTRAETRDTQMCRDTMVENPCVIECLLVLVLKVVLSKKFDKFKIKTIFKLSDNN